jgi:hypothetical protein
MYKIQQDYLLTPNIALPNDDRLIRLKSFQAAADSASAHYQRHIIGQLSASTLSGAFKKINNLIKDKTPFPYPIVLIIFMLGLPFSVVLFELNSAFNLNIWFLASYVLVLGGVFYFYLYKV